MAKKNNRRAKIVGTDIELDVTEKQDVLIESHDEHHDEHDGAGFRRAFPLVLAELFLQPALDQAGVAHQPTALIREHQDSDRGDA